MNSQQLRWSVDSLVQRGTTVFSYGWIFNPHKKIAHLSLLLTDGTTETACIQADYGKARDDVGAHFADCAQATHSGYVVYGTFSAPLEGRQLKLRCTYNDGTTESVAIPESYYRSDNKARPENTAARRALARQLFILAKRAVVLLRRGKFTLLFNKLKRYNKGTSIRRLKNSAQLTQLLTPQQREKVIFILDHDLGGGANHYRDRMIDKKLEQGFTALILTFDISTLSHKIIIKTPEKTWKFKIASPDLLLALAPYMTLREIVYNTGVSLIRPETLPGFLLDLKLKTGATLTTLAHDFFPLCPSHFLINDQGRYCDIPDVAACRRCLKNNRWGFTALFEGGDIKYWREQWGALIAGSDKLIAFSQNTLDLYRRVYHQIQPDNAEVIPHTVSYLPRKAKITQRERLCIGVVGNIGYHKGAEVVKGLALEIKKRHYPASIVVIGALDSSCPTDIVTQTGPYAQHQLADLLEAHGVNIILFPSIWPETFSYVVQEMIELGYPVASFNLGAPAERLKHYSKGRILPSMSAGNVLQELIEFHQNSYLT